jgi:hypothetical protein
LVCGLSQLPGQDSNLDKENQNAFRACQKPLCSLTSGDMATPLAPQLAPETKTSLPAALDPDLTRIMECWPALSEPIRRAMLALAESAQTAR